MLSDLIRRLMGAAGSSELAVEDARIALAALMVRLARSDGSYTSEETDRIDRALMAQHRIDAEEARVLRTQGEDAEAGAPDTVRFTRLVKNAVPYEDREAVVEALWRVAAVDGIHADEHGFLRLVSNLVGVSDRNSGLARQRVLRDEAE